jgi:hypothetical protein
MSIPRSSVSGVVGAFKWLHESNCQLLYWPRMALKLWEHSKIHCLQVMYCKLTKAGVYVECWYLFSRFCPLHFPYFGCLVSAECQRIWIASRLLNVFQKLVPVVRNSEALLPIKACFLLLMEYDTCLSHQVYLWLCIKKVKWRARFVFEAVNYLNN